MVFYGANLLFILVCFGSIVLTFAHGQKLRSNDDLITSLPGLAEMPSFSMFSGYLSASETKRLHYWFNECVVSSNTLIVWFNGGPGCSSLDGLLIEHGPFKFDGHSAKLVPNPYSWNKIAHTLYIEAPAGVGFSYDTNDNPIWNDNITAADNLNALKDFFRKFPSHRSSNIYISGESYAGVYVPSLVEAIIDHDEELRHNLKGLMIGNGLLNVGLNEQSLIYFSYYHGLFGSELWDQLQRYCCDEERHCSFNSFYNEDCMLKVAHVHHLVTNDGLNMYNLYGNCYTESQSRRINRRQNLFEQFQRDKVLNMMKVNEPRSYQAALYARKFSLVPTCSDASLITEYLNREDVQTAIHVRPVTWEICNEDVLSEYEQQNPDVAPILKTILEKTTDFKMLIYFGDVDMACNHMGGEWFVDQLGYQVVVPRRKWMVEGSGGSNQVAGFYKVYDRLIFATVKGAGHMVPADKPREALTMIRRFLDDDPL